MHELSLAESMLELIQRAAVEQQFSAVRVVWLELGSMACVEPEALRFCFESVARDTLAQHARLEWVSIPGRGECPDCGSHHPQAQLLDPCPVCASCRVVVSGGDGMRIKALDVI
jgi:hydrogenase nickel incorporation protein HypA/HybF